MTHLSPEELLRWRDRAQTEDRDRVVSHLAACGSCAAAYAELTRIAPVLETPVHFNPADFVARGYAVRHKENAVRAPFWLSWKVWAGALGAVGVLLVVGALLPGQGPTDGPRGAAIEIVAPAALTDHPEKVTWTTGVTAARFHVELVDSAGATRFQTTTATPGAELPADHVTALVPSRSYTWKVTALDKDGEPIATASKTFTIAGTGAR